MNDQEHTNEALLELTAGIVSAYVSNNPVPVADLSFLIGDVKSALDNLSPPPRSAEEPPKPAVSPKRSVHDDYIICLDDGKKFKSLKRHLATHGLAPSEYRAKWNLPADYPMVAPSYSAARSTMAKEIGLGRKQKAAPKPEARPARRARKLTTT